MSGLVNATWVGPAGWHLDDGTVLVPGETVLEVTAGEAEASENWEAPSAPKKPKGGDD